MADVQDVDMGGADEAVQAQQQEGRVHREQQRLAGAAAQLEENRQIMEEWSDDDDLSDQANAVMQRRDQAAAAKAVTKANANAAAVSDSNLHKQFKPPELKLFAPGPCDKFINSFGDYEKSLFRHSQTIKPIPLTTCITPRVLQTIKRKNKIKADADATVEVIRKAIQDMAKSQDKERNKKRNVIKSVEHAMTRANLKDSVDWIEVCANYDDALQVELKDTMNTRLERDRRLPLLKTIARLAKQGPIRKCLDALITEVTDEKRLPRSINAILDYIDGKLRILGEFAISELQCDAGSKKPASARESSGDPPGNGGADADGVIPLSRSERRRLDKKNKDKRKRDHANRDRSDTDVPPKKPSIVCTFCNKPNHTADVCHSKQREDAAKRQQAAPKRQQDASKSQGAGKYQHTPETRTCYKCHESGHIAANCPRK